MGNIVKKIFIVLSICSLSLIYADDSRLRQYKDLPWMSVDISPLKAISGIAELSFQLKLVDFMSLEIPVQIGYVWPVSLGFQTIIKSNLENSALAIDPRQTRAPIVWGVGALAKFYFNGQAFKSGWFAGPQLKFLSFQYGMDFPYSAENQPSSEHSINMNIKALSAQAVIGYEWHLESGWFLGLRLSGGYAFFLEPLYSVDGPLENTVLLNLSKFISPAIKGVPIGAFDFRFGYSW